MTLLLTQSRLPTKKQRKTKSGTSEWSQCATARGSRANAPNAKRNSRQPTVLTHFLVQNSGKCGDPLELFEDYQRWEDEQNLADIEAVGQEIKQEGTVPWETVKANLLL